MTIGEIKAEVLKLMNINEALNLSALDVGTLYDDPTYAGYLYSMPPAINRALDRFYLTEAYEGTERISTDTSDETDIESLEGDLSPELVRLIPLYVVSEVFSAEEPSYSAEKRNEFEILLEGYLKSSRYSERQTQVEVVEKVW